MMGIILLPAIIFSVYAQIKVDSAYNSIMIVKTQKGLSASQVASKMRQKKDIFVVDVKKVAGRLTDYYSDKEKTVALSQDIYDSDSVAAVGIAMHEVGHAIQYAEGYKMVHFRNIMIRVSNISSVVLWPLVIIGLFLNLAVVGSGVIGSIFAWCGIGFFGIAVILNLITLPVEFDASNRAKKLMEQENLLTAEERIGAAKVLNAAAMTYVAALMVSVMNLIRFILVVVMNSDRRRR